MNSPWGNVAGGKPNQPEVPGTQMVSNWKPISRSTFLSVAKAISGGHVILKKSPNLGGFGDIEASGSPDGKGSPFKESDIWWMSTLSPHCAPYLEISENWSNLLSIGIAGISSDPFSRLA